jgi:hypothetical protein
VPAELFQLLLTDGPATTWHQRNVGDFERAFDWSSLRPEAYAAKVVERARLAWTHQALSEYGTAVSMTQLVDALARALAPIDLITMAATFATQELAHAELYSRLAMTMGGGAPVELDPAQLGVRLGDTQRSPREHANELVVLLCCVGEAFSCPMLSAGIGPGTHPLVRAVLEHVVREEALHARLGWLYLDWVSDELSTQERERLAKVAGTMLERVADTLPKASAAAVPDEELAALGWLNAVSYRARALRAVQEVVVAPLAERGIGVEVPARFGA